MAFYKHKMTAFLLLNKNFLRGQFRLADGGLFLCFSSNNKDSKYYIFSCLEDPALDIEPTGKYFYFTQAKASVKDNRGKESDIKTQEISLK